MFVKARAFLLSLTIVAVLVFSAVGTTVVYADGGSPPDTVTEDTVQAKGEVTPVPTVELAPRVEGQATPVPTEAVAVPGKEESTPAEETSSAPQTAPVRPHTGSPADKPILMAVPQNTTVAVINPQGRLQPLATQAASDAIATTTDPIWCPGSQPPTPGLNGCTQSFSSFTLLLNFLAGNASFTGPGTIYVEQGNYQGGESTINFNNFNLSNISSSDLTITGGWTGSANSTSTFNNVSIIIGSSGNPWGGSLTISNITITNPSGTGITANAQNNINLSNVTVTNSTNGAGAELTAGIDVNINNSRFERNKTAGAIIRAGRDVSIANSSFSNPANARRQIVGLDIFAGNAVSLAHVLANANREAGATIEAGGPVAIGGVFNPNTNTWLNSEFSGTMAIVGPDFRGYGLTVTTPGDIALDHVIADRNFLWGASLTTTAAGGDVSIANSTFNANTTESSGFIDDTGLIVNSQGLVSILNSHADDNRLIGATITAVGDVSISNSTFNSNNGVILDSAGNPTFYGYGLQVITNTADPTTVANIFLEGVTASGNTLFGAHLEADGDVIVSTSTFSDQTSVSATYPTPPVETGRGLEIISGGNVRLDHVTLNHNQTFGAHIQAGADVFLDTVTADGNGTTGVEVQTNCGTLVLMGGAYQNNGQYGLSVLSTNLTPGVPPVFANNGAGNIFQDPGACPVTPPAPPPSAYRPNDLSPVSPRLPGANPFARSLSISAAASWSAMSNGAVTLNSYLAGYAAYSRLHIGPFVGSYAYIYLASGMQIVFFAPNSSNEFAMK